MDPARLWLQARRKQQLAGGDQKAPVFTSPRITVGAGATGGRGTATASYYESWEERAFAEDSAENLGGCIWPPRSYACSFCGREFRSAQALGGHMNVHRRDRARLKLSGVAEDTGQGMPPPPPSPLQRSYMIQLQAPLPPIGLLQQAHGRNPSLPCTDANAGSICSVLRPYHSTPLAQAAAATKQVLSAQLAADEPRRPAASGISSNQELHAGRCEVKLSILGCQKQIITRDFDQDCDQDDDGKTVHVSCKRRRSDLEVNSLDEYSSSGHNHQQEHFVDYGHDDNSRAKVQKLLNCPSSKVQELDLELRLGGALKK